MMTSSGDDTDDGAGKGPTLLAQRSLADGDGVGPAWHPSFSKRLSKKINRFEAVAAPLDNKLLRAER